MSGVRRLELVGALEGEGEAQALTAFALEDILAYPGNLADMLAPSGEMGLDAIGRLVVDEYKLDEAARAAWKRGAEKALKTAGQEKGEEKTYPFKKAANIKFPLLTTASIQFAARAYPAIVRGDEVVDIKINGQDKDSVKAKRAERVAAFMNDQLSYQCPEWESGTDALLHQLPITGAAFRKVYWDVDLNRPRLDYAPAMSVTIPADCPSIDMAPRVTHRFTRYPHQYEALVRQGYWRRCEVQADNADTQAPIAFLEQCRYLDLDRDGLSEPYIITVHEETAAVLRIDPAFDVEDVTARPVLDGKTGEESWEIVAIERLLPWIDYCFLPDPQGGAYGIGFGKLLEALSDTIDTLLNQMVDAGHLANVNTGFVGSGVKVRGGAITMEPNSFKQLEGVTNLREALMRMEFPGPNPVSFNLLDLLLNAARDITAVKDVLTGEAPSQQPATSTLALIEQGLQVFTSIYKRIFRSMQRELALLARLNKRYLAPEAYQRFLDQQAQSAPDAAPQPQGAPNMGHNGGPPMTPQEMAPAEPPADPRVDFDLSDMDIRPVSDPTAVTEMQRLAKANFLMQFVNDPAADRLEILHRVNKAARIDGVEKIFPRNNPALAAQAQAAQAAQQLDMQAKQAEAQRVAADAQVAQANAQKAQAEAALAHEQPLFKQRELDQRDRELAQRDLELKIEQDKLALEAFRADMEDADREMSLVLKQAGMADAAQARHEQREDAAAQHARQTAFEREKIDRSEAQREIAALQVQGARDEEDADEDAAEALTGKEIAAALQSIAQSIEKLIARA